jgi:hypothetical protein
MTERGPSSAEGARVCPFVAFDEDRDARADRPDHRHRCFAEARPAPRALAHQEAYCLSSSFAACPTFQDWARREAARARPGFVAAPPEPRPEPPPERHPLPPPDRGWVSPGDVVPGELDDPPRRSRGRDWKAPPPWSAGEAVGPDQPGVEGDEPGTPPFLADRRGQESDAYARDRPHQDEEPYRDAEPYRRAAPYGGRGPERAGPPPIDPGGDLRERDARAVEDDRDAGDEERYAPRHERERERGRGLDRRPRVGESRRRREPDPEAPSWERPRRYEAYPTLRTRVGLPNLPRIGVALVAVLAAAAALFFLPPLFLGLGDDGQGPGAGASSVPSAAPSASVEPTPVPSPTPQTYVIKKGDTLSKIATRFGVTVDDILAANKETIKDADKISEGQEIVIPVPPSAGSPAASGAEPSPSP